MLFQTGEYLDHVDRIKTFFHNILNGSNLATFNRWIAKFNTFFLFLYDLRC